MQRENVNKTVQVCDKLRGILPHSTMSPVKLMATYILLLHCRAWDGLYDTALTNLEAGSTWRDLRVDREDPEDRRSANKILGAGKPSGSHLYDVSPSTREVSPHLDSSPRLYPMLLKLPG